MTKPLLILITVLILGCGTNDSSNATKEQLTDTLDTKSNTPTNWTFDKIVDSKLVFKNGQTFDTRLFELQYIGQIPADNKVPYFVFSGRYCDECDANISIYIHSPSNGQPLVDYGQNRYQYPGTETDYESEETLYISRAFYGQVLDDIKGVIWYESRLMENDEMKNFIYLTQIKNGLLKDTSYQDNGTLDKTINLLKDGLCFEIKGREFTSEP